MVAVPAVRMLTREVYALVRPAGEWDNSTKLTAAVVKELLEVMKDIPKSSPCDSAIVSSDSEPSPEKSVDDLDAHVGIADAHFLKER